MKIDYSTIRLLSVHQGESSPGRARNNRKNHMLLLKTSGENYYYMEKKTWLVRSGDMIFMPHGSSYAGKNIVPGGYISIVFWAEGDGLIPCKLRIPEARSLFEQILHARQKPAKHNQLHCLSLFFELLYRLSLSASCEYLSPKAKALVQTAAEEIEARVAESDFRLSELAPHYQISHAYFCSVFRTIFGCSPSEYLARVRLERAQEWLLSGRSVSETATACGFSDPLYFSKFFRRRMGLPPLLLCKSIGRMTPSIIPCERQSRNGMSPFLLVFLYKGSAALIYAF